MAAGAASPFVWLKPRHRAIPVTLCASVASPAASPIRDLRAPRSKIQKVPPQVWPANVRAKRSCQQALLTIRIGVSQQSGRGWSRWELLAARQSCAKRSMHARPSCLVQNSLCRWVVRSPTLRYRARRFPRGWKGLPLACARTS